MLKASLFFYSEMSFVVGPHDNIQRYYWQDSADACFSCRSRQLELEDKQSMLELELRKYMEINGVYFGVHTERLVTKSVFWCS